jgi:8-oxo-dGTP diphosphatase
MTSRWILVVAGAIAGEEGRWLMHQRPFEKHHGGLWEFPGGKVEEAEIPVESLVRELREELGIEISPADCVPAHFAQGWAQDDQTRIVILLYTIAAYSGTPEALEGESIGWFTPAEVAILDKPPLDVALARQLFASASPRSQ